MNNLLDQMDPLAGILGLAFCFSFLLGIYVCIKTKKGRKFLGLE
jgi:hypothetical protein